MIGRKEKEYMRCQKEKESKYNNKKRAGNIEKVIMLCIRCLSSVSIELKGKKEEKRDKRNEEKIVRKERKKWEEKSEKCLFWKFIKERKRKDMIFHKL